MFIRREMIRREMFRSLLRDKKIAFVTHNDGFDPSSKQGFSIPQDARLAVTAEQQARLAITKDELATQYFSLDVGCDDGGRQVFKMKSDEQSVRELFAILENSGLKVGYTAMGEHMLVNNADDLVYLIKAEKSGNDERKRNNLEAKTNARKY